MELISKKDIIFINDDIPLALLLTRIENSRSFDKNSSVSDQENNDIKGIIILCELNKNESEETINRQELYGIKLAIDLRLKGIKFPILFISFLSRKQICDRKPEREIINAVGHNFVRLPVKTDEMFTIINNMEPLNDLELYDIQNSYCRKEGIIRETAHRLSNVKYFDLDKKNIQELEIELTTAIKTIANVYNEQPSLFLIEFWERYKKLNENNLSDAISDIGRYGERLINEHTRDSQDDQDYRKRKWKLIWIDDEVKDNHKLVTLLEQKGVSTILCSSAVKAIDILEKDWSSNNSIGVVLADYRLEEIKDGVKVHQIIQGYSLLKNIAESGRMIRLAALSALPRKFLLHSFKHYNVRTEVFSKRDYLEDDHTYNLLCNQLVALGDENEEAILSMPGDSLGWRNLQPAYQLYRNAPDYIAREAQISRTATEYANYFMKEKKFPNYVPFSKTKFTLKKETEKTLKSFQRYWLGRRLAIWLSGVQHYSNKEITLFLQGPDNSKNDDGQGYKQIISTCLALTTSDYPFNLALEEKNWLHDKMCVPIYKEIDLQKNLQVNLINTIRNFARENKIPIEINYSFTSYHHIKLLYNELEKHLVNDDELLIKIVSHLKTQFISEIKKHGGLSNNCSRNMIILLNLFVKKYAELSKKLCRDDKSIYDVNRQKQITNFYEMIKANNFSNTESLSEYEYDLFVNVLTFSKNDENELVSFDILLSNLHSYYTQNSIYEYKMVLYKEGISTDNNGKRNKKKNMSD